MKWGLKGGILIDTDLGLLGVYFDAVVVEVKTFLFLFRLALAILWVNWFRNVFLVSSILPKNERKEFDLRYDSS